jgi:hypothetical protein
MRTELDGYLQALAHVNWDGQIDYQFELHRLPDAASLEDALASYFTAMEDGSPPEPGSVWHIQLGPPDSGCGKFSTALDHWFFRQPSSPQLKEAESHPRILEHCLKLLAEQVGEFTAREVFVEAPIFYDLIWQDFALEGDSGRWLLHLSFCD